MANLAQGARGDAWTARAVGRAIAVPLPVEETSAPQFPSLSREELIGWDYQRSGHSTRGHPLSELRHALRAQGLPTARELSALPNGRSARYAGLVICRQRPGTASGVVFMTLEDETGFVNLVVWSQVFERHVVLGESEYFLGVSGKVQKQDGVVNLIAEALYGGRSNYSRARGQWKSLAATSTDPLRVYLPSTNQGDAGLFPDAPAVMPDAPTLVGAQLPSLQLFNPRPSA